MWRSYWNVSKCYLSYIYLNYQLYKPIKSDWNSKGSTKKLDKQNAYNLKNKSAIRSSTHLKNPYNKTKVEAYDGNVTTTYGDSITSNFALYFYLYFEAKKQILLL